MNLERLERFTTLLLHLNRALFRFRFYFGNFYNLKPFHVVIIYYIGRMGEKGLTQKDLVHISSEDKGNISRRLTYLYDRGIVIDKKRDIPGSYSTAITLSPYGSRIYNELLRHMDLLFNNSLDDEDKAIEVFSYLDNILSLFYNYHLEIKDE